MLTVCRNSNVPEYFIYKMKNMEFIWVAETFGIFTMINKGLIDYILTKLTNYSRTE